MTIASRAVLSLAACSSMTLFGAVAQIGVVNASGDFHVAGASVRNNGTLFAGDMIESDNLRASVVLNDGKQLTLSPHSRGKVFADKTILEGGTSEVRVSSGYLLEAGIFRVSVPNGDALVAFSPDSGRLRVASYNGQVSVRNASGTLVANIVPGRALDLDPQGGGGSSAVTYTGTVRKVNGKYLLTDDTTGVTVELQGKEADLEKSVGKKRKVTGAIITGAAAAAGATAVVSVTSVAVAAAAAGAAAGVSAGVITAVVVGGAAAAAVGGAAAAGAFSSSSP